MIDPRSMPVVYHRFMIVFCTSRRIELGLVHEEKKHLSVGCILAMILLLIFRGIAFFKSKGLSTSAIKPFDRGKYLVILGVHSSDIGLADGDSIKGRLNRCREYKWTSACIIPVNGVSKVCSVRCHSRPRWTREERQDKTLNHFPNFIKPGGWNYCKPKDMPQCRQE
ncbi:hypothetical protein BC941DRAFT_188956 [Chlamydoabsidia padenii]|nr:hypothetical protein BC941DRAFT_188956 [Chlamydoabsidia padenii]